LQNLWPNKEDCVPPRTDLREVISTGKKIRCVLAHGHVLLRQGLRRLLEDEPDLDVVSEAGNAAECLRKVCEFQPDVVIADVGTFGRPVPDAELLVTRESPQTKIVFLSMEEQSSSRFGGLQAVTEGCTVRQTSVEELVEMVRKAAGGSPENHNATNHNATNHIATNHISTSQIPANHIPAKPREAASGRDLRRSDEVFPQERGLTARERDVLKLLAEGKTVRAAAAVLGLSSKTVDAHKFNLMRKLGIHNKAELVMWAIQKRVVKIPANF
jgi:two-component system, NarL family, response regulator NreC